MRRLQRLFSSRSRRTCLVPLGDAPPDRSHPDHRGNSRRARPVRGNHPLPSAPCTTTVEKAVDDGTAKIHCVAATAHTDPTRMRQASRRGATRAGAPRLVVMQLCPGSVGPRSSRCSKRGRCLLPSRRELRFLIRRDCPTCPKSCFRERTSHAVQDEGQRP